MRWTGGVALAAVVGSGVLAATMISCGSQQGASPPAMSAADRIARGRYLSIVGGCNDCHTPGLFYGAPDTTRTLSGSELGWEGPWGVTYPRNLTPDAETGLGKYSEEDIVRAIRTGRRLDGSPMMPPMPWFNYAQMSDDDLHSLVAYVQSIPAVSHKAPDRLPPGTRPPVALTFPPPPAWDAKNLPPPPGAAPAGEIKTKK